MTSAIGAVSYGAAAVAFLVFSALLVTSWRGRLRGVLLAAASFVTGLWALALAYEAANGGAPVPAGYVLEVLRSGAWFAFLLVLLGYSAAAMRPLRLAALGIGAYCVATLAAQSMTGGPGASRTDVIGILSALILAVIGMVLAEQLFRNVQPEQRWGIKFLCLGVCGIFGYDFYLYSHALLFRGVDPDVWAARGAVNALVVPLLAVATARNPKWSLEVAVSRRIVFHATMVFGAAVYLVAMAGVGYYIRYVGGTWGGVLQATLLFAAVLMMFIMFFSGTVRAQIKLFLNRNFFTFHYDYREEWLRFTGMLSEGKPGIELRERSIQAIAELVDSPGGALWFARETGTFEAVANWNMPAAHHPGTANIPVREFPAQRQHVIDLTRAGEDTSGASIAGVPACLRSLPQAWLVVPLILHQELLGFVVLARSKGKVRLNWEVCDILETAGRQAASYLAQLEAAKALLVARQFESFNRMSAFVVHDLKNLIAQLSLLLSNADRHRHNPAFHEDMIETVSHSVNKMRRLLLQLRGAYSLEPPTPVALQELLRRAVAAKAGAGAMPTLDLPPDPVSVLAHASRLERVLGHLVQNAIDATTNGGNVHVSLSTRDGNSLIEIADSGCGMSERFVRERLFNPFESTKATGMGIGAYEAQEYVQELGGRIEVESKPGEGSTFRVIVPLLVAAPAPEAGGVLEVQT